MRVSVVLAVVLVAFLCAAVFVALTDIDPGVSRVEENIDIRTWRLREMG